MKQKRVLSKLNQGILVLVIFALLLGAVAVTYGTYTNSQKAQRTIAAYDAGGDRFSSNYLNPYNYLNPGLTYDNVRTVYVANTAISPGTVVTVCNYQQGKQTRPNDQPITYTLTARLVKYDGSDPLKYVAVDGEYVDGLNEDDLTPPDEYSVSVAKGDGTPVVLDSSNVSTTFSDCSLAAGSAASDIFSLSFSPNFTENQPNLYVELVATPSGGNYLPLRGVFRTGIRLAGASNDWSGAFSDDDSNDPSAYDGLNYMISGVGSGTFTLKWNTEFVELSATSLLDLLAIEDATHTSNGYIHTVTFDVDSDTVPRYDLQFYKLDPLTAFSAVGGWSDDMNVTLASAEANLASVQVVGYYFTH